jgi:hypothetical protein
MTPERVGELEVGQRVEESLLKPLLDLMKSLEVGVAACSRWQDAPYWSQPVEAELFLDRPVAH